MKGTGSIAPLQPKLGSLSGKLEQHESQSVKASATKQLQRKQAVCHCKTARPVARVIMDASVYRQHTCRKTHWACGAIDRACDERGYCPHTLTASVPTVGGEWKAAQKAMLKWCESPRGWPTIKSGDCGSSACLGSCADPHH